MANRDTSWMLDFLTNDTHTSDGDYIALNIIAHHRGIDQRAFDTLDHIMWQTNTWMYSFQRYDGCPEHAVMGFITELDVI